ncbi:hypothetical protein BV133_1333 [Blastochloris viridis]|uniref:Uncharacterized protein n=1 Tax=Blastochloris viridis TaxID=1079 RepID=A0A182D095_BLAVI|nr:hypothetical protein BV133_1333 [Blastochloris viridis]
MLALAPVAPAAAFASGDAPMVVELFTSQGCSSCPPADSYISELADRPGVIALSLAVDYWDYLGWKDTLAQPGNSARQRAYAASLGDRRLFTPQMVVNGRESAPGHDRATIEHALRTARALTRATLPVRVSAEPGDGRVDVTIADAGGRSGEVWALGVQRRVRVDIGRGENAGRTATYRNVVRSMTKVASWSGRRVTVSLDTAEWLDEGCDLVVVLVQDAPEGRLGPVIGAATAALR